MSGGFLGLAYIGELSVVFNLAYSELRDRRYVKYAEAKVQVLNDKLGDNQLINKKDSNLYAHLEGLTNREDAHKRRTAWSCCDPSGVGSALASWFLSDLVFPFFSFRRDRNWALIFCAVASVMIIAATLLDHFWNLQGILSEGEYTSLWCSFLTVLLGSLLYPVITVFLGRKMMKRLDLVSNHLISEFGKIVGPAVQTAILEDVEAARKATEEKEHGHA